MHVKLFFLFLSDGQEQKSWESEMRGLSVRHHQGSVCVKGLEFHPQNSQVFFFFSLHTLVCAFPSSLIGQLTCLKNMGLTGFCSII